MFWRKHGFQATYYDAYNVSRSALYAWRKIYCMMDYLIWYNTKRPHWSLQPMSLVDYLIKNNYLSRMWWTNTKHLLIISAVVQCYKGYIVGI